MLRFSANLSMLYPQHSFLDRFAAAAADGFKGVEYVGAYDYPATQIADVLRENGLTQVLFNLPVGDWVAGERGIACLPDRQDEFRSGVDQAIGYAHETGCKQVNCLAGIAPPGADRQDLEATLVSNLQFAAARFADAGIKLLLEPINTKDMPGYLINTTDHYDAIAARVGIDNLYLQYDFYHMQIMQGDLIRTFERLQPRIAHVQIADNPGRHEPGTGEINYANIFTALSGLGYTGWIGAEYRPSGDTSSSFGWVPE